MQTSNQTKRTLWALAGLAIIVVLGALAYAYRARIQLGWSVLLDETGSKSAATACVVIGLFLLVSLILWMLFPVMVYLGLKDLRRRTSELDGAIKLCAHHLSRITEERGLAQGNSAQDRLSKP